MPLNSVNLPASHRQRSTDIMIAKALKVFSCASFLAATPVLTVSVEIETPEDYITSVSQEIGTAVADMQGSDEVIKERRSEIMRNLLNEHFDMVTSARMVLGRHWKTTDQDDRKRFEDAFRAFFINTHAKNLQDFNWRTLEVEKVTIATDTRAARVRTGVMTNEEKLVVMICHLRRTDSGWKIWDIVLDGVSFVKIYRVEYNIVITNDGLDDLIVQLNGRAAEGL